MSRPDLALCGVAIYARLLCPRVARCASLTELTRLLQEYGHECDLWSAGATMHELLTGSTPFWEHGTPLNAKEVVTRILTEVRDAHSTLRRPSRHSHPDLEASSDSEHLSGGPLLKRDDSLSRGRQAPLQGCWLSAMQLSPKRHSGASRFRGSLRAVS